MSEMELKRARAKAKAKAAVAVQSAAPPPPQEQVPVQVMPMPSNVAVGGYERGHPSEVSFGTHLRAGMAQPEDKIKRYAHAMGRPESEFGVIDGEIVHWDGKKYRKVVPDVVGTPVDAFYRVGDNVAASTSRALPAVASGISGLITRSPTIAGAVGGVVNLGLQAADKALAGEKVATTKYDPWSPIVDTGLGVGGQLAGNFIAKLFTRNPAGVTPWDRLKAMDPVMLDSAEALQQTARNEFGINLSVGQATGLRSMLMRERQVARYPETADDVSDFVRLQNEAEVPTAIHGAIRSLSPKGGEAAVHAFREGGGDVVAQGLKQRSAEATAAYKIAYDANKDITSPTLNRLLNTSSGRDALRQTRLEMADRMKLMAVPDEELTQQMRVLADIGKMNRINPGVAKGLKLETWDLIKRKLWDIEQSMINPKTMKPTSGGEAVKNIRQKLTRELDNLDKTKIAGPNSTFPGPGAYEKARLQYGDASEALEIVLKGGPGIVQRMKGLDHERILNQMFTEARMTPEEIVRTRQAYYATGNGGAWDAGVARWLDGVLNKALKPTMTFDPTNVAGKFYVAAYGTPQQKAITEAAIGRDKFPVFDRLLNILDHARRSLLEGSPTVTDMGVAAAPDAISTGARRAGALLSTDTYLNVGRKGAEVVADMRQPEARRRLVEVLLSPHGIKELRKLKMVSPGTEAAFRTTVDALIKTGVLTGISALTPGETRAAPASLNRGPRLPAPKARQ